MSFIGELENLINRFSMENGSDTPDFLLAEYLNRCLDNWNLTVTARERWYGRIVHEKGPVLIKSSVPVRSPTGCHHHESAFTDEYGKVMSDCSACHDGGFDR